MSPLEWPSVVGRLHAERNLWLTTVAPEGGPHAVPVWAAAVGDVLHVYTSRGTRKARNLTAEPRVVMHLPDPEDVLIVEGSLRDIGHPADLPDVVAAFAATYPAPDDVAYLPGVDPTVDVVYALVPRRVMAWRLADFEHSQRRWEAP